MSKKITFVFLSMLLISCSERITELKLASLFVDNMVLQRNTEVSIWGWATPEAKVRITTSWGERAKVRAAEDGSWLAVISTKDALESQTICVSAGNRSDTIDNVVFGEVWLCSGQSNMEMPLSGWPPNDTINNSAHEIATANFPEIRMFTVQKTISIFPLDTCVGSWQICSPENAVGFSATAYFYGRELHKELGVPIGLIHSSWGGTPAESWTHPDNLASVPGYENVKELIDASVNNSTDNQKWLQSLKSIRISNLQGEEIYKDIDFDDRQMNNPDFDDSSWDLMPVPSVFENYLGNFDGAVWFRKEFSLSGDEENTNLKLFLGTIDDIDATYLNGIKIGGFEKDGFWKQERSYDIPAGLLKQGKNTVAIRVIDVRGGGGIYGNMELGIIKNNKYIVKLNGDWKYLPVALFVGNNIRIFGEGEKSFKSMPLAGIQQNQNSPSVLYNAMIAPLVPYTIKGAIWYQGESNVGRGKQYRQLFPAMIKSWREAWGLGNFPFYYVQIAPFNYNESISGVTAELREAQLLSMKVENTGMVVTMDIGIPDNIHPGSKQEVGRRLALWAAARTYGREGVVFSGPIFEKMEVIEDKAIVHFTHVGSGLYSPDGEVSHFELSGADLRFFPAKAVIDQNTVIVSSPKVREPMFVRYAWSDKAQPNLFNREGLPASPFRSTELIVNE